MTEAHAKVTAYANELISVPRAHLALEIRQEKDGLKLLYRNCLLVEFSLTREGMVAAGYMAQSLGAKVPPLGQSIDVRVSTGVLFRTISIATLDFNNRASYALLDRWLEEAELQRGGTSAVP